MHGFREKLTSHRLSFLMPVLLDQPSLQGVLRVRRGDVSRSFHLRDGWLEGFASSAAGEQLAQTLVDRGLLEVSAAAAAYDTALERGVALGELLAESGLVPMPLLREVLASRARVGLVDCYGWEAGEVEWESGPRMRKGIGLRLRLRTLHDEALGAWREWREALERFGGLCSRVQAAEGAAAVCTPEEAGLVEAAQAGPTVDELLGTGERRLAVARLLVALHRRGLLRAEESPASPRQVLAEAKACLDAGQFERARELACGALAHWPVPEAQRLFHQAESGAALQARRDLLSMARRLRVEPFDRRKARALTAADLYVYRRLAREQSLEGAFRTVPELTGYRSIRRLLEAGLVQVTEEAS